MLIILVNGVCSKSINNKLEQYESDDGNNISESTSKLLRKLFSFRKNSYNLDNDEDEDPSDDGYLDLVNNIYDESGNLLQPSNKNKSIKKIKINEISRKSKRGFQIQTYYDALVQNDGSILLIPKDVNKNHYFIG
jgi:hypothetical protein